MSEDTRPKAEDGTPRLRFSSMEGGTVTSSDDSGSEANESGLLFPSMQSESDEGKTPREISEARFFPEDISYFRSVVERFADKDDIADLNQNGLGDHPSMLESFKSHEFRMRRLEELNKGNPDDFGFRQEMNGLIKSAIYDGRAAYIKKCGPLPGRFR